jgi:hypothetical protein
MSPATVAPARGRAPDVIRRLNSPRRERRWLVRGDYMRPEGGAMYPKCRKRSDSAIKIQGQIRDRHRIWCHSAVDSWNAPANVGKCPARQCTIRSGPGLFVGLGAQPVTQAVASLRRHGEPPGKVPEFAACRLRGRQDARVPECQKRKPRVSGVLLAGFCPRLFAVWLDGLNTSAGVVLQFRHLHRSQVGHAF